MSKLQVKSDVMNDLGVGAGLLLKSAPSVDENTHAITISDSSILGATRGGITFNPNPQTRSRAVDGLASNTVGIHTVDRYEPTVSGTFITEDLYLLLKAVGFGDISGDSIIARHEPVTASDYVDLWFIQPKSDGSSILIKIKNAICTAGSAIKSNDNGETEIPLSFVGNYTIADQNTPPFEITRIPPVVTPEPVVEEEPAEQNQSEEQ